MEQVKIKKAFQPLVAAIQEAVDNGQCDDSVLGTVLDLAKAKTGAGKTGPKGLRTALKDVEGNVVAIKDYYFKKWMPLIGPEAVEFGKKANSATGYNTMSKEGAKLWAAQQKEAREALANILVEVEEGTLDPADISARKEEIEEARKRIEPIDAGFDSLEDVRAYLEEQGVQLED